MNAVPTISAHTASQLSALPISEHAQYLQHMLAVAAAGLMSIRGPTAAIEDVYRVADAMVADHHHG